MARASEIDPTHCAACRALATEVDRLLVENEAQRREIYRLEVRVIDLAYTDPEDLSLKRPLPAPHRDLYSPDYEPERLAGWDGF